MHTSFLESIRRVKKETEIDPYKDFIHLIQDSITRRNRVKHKILTIVNKDLAFSKKNYQYELFTQSSRNMHNTSEIQQNKSYHNCYSNSPGKLALPCNQHLKSIIPKRKHQIDKQIGNYVGQELYEKIKNFEKDDIHKDNLRQAKNNYGRKFRLDKALNSQLPQSDLNLLTNYVQFSKKSQHSKAKLNMSNFDMTCPKADKTSNLKLPRFANQNRFGSTAAEFLGLRSRSLFDKKYSYPEKSSTFDESFNRYAFSNNKNLDYVDLQPKKNIVIIPVKNQIDSKINELLTYEKCDETNTYSNKFSYGYNHKLKTKKLKKQQDCKYKLCNTDITLIDDNYDKNDSNSIIQNEQNEYSSGGQVNYNEENCQENFENTEKDLKIPVICDMTPSTKITHKVPQLIKKAQCNRKLHNYDTEDDGQFRMKLKITEEQYDLAQDRVYVEQDSMQSRDLSDQSRWSAKSQDFGYQQRKFALDSKKNIKMNFNSSKINAILGSK